MFRGEGIGGWNLKGIKLIFWGKWVTNFELLQVYETFYFQEEWSNNWHKYDPYVKKGRKLESRYLREDKYDFFEKTIGI